MMKPKILSSLILILCIYPVAVKSQGLNGTDRGDEKFEFYPWLDGGLLLGGLGFQLYSNYRLGELDSYRNEPKDLFAWDKPWVGQKNDLAVNWSNYLSYPGVAIGLGYSVYEAFGNSKSSYLVQDLTLLSEILTFNSAINLFIRGFGFWPRPLYFNEEGPKKESGEILGSFYSGHASAAFAVATYYSLAITHRYGFEKTWWVSSLSVLTASTIAYLRVEGGKHYPSDVIVGALAGTAISSLFYFWRAKDGASSPSRNEKGLSARAQIPSGISLTYSF